MKTMSLRSTFVFTRRWIQKLLKTFLTLVSQAPPQVASKNLKTVLEEEKSGNTRKRGEIGITKFQQLFFVIFSVIKLFNTENDDVGGATAENVERKSPSSLPGDEH